MAISRSREYQADKLGAEICRQPLWLASALQKISNSVKQIHNNTAERDPATAHMFIINPLSGERADKLFSTHPNTENRIARLQELAREWGQTGQRRPAMEQTRTSSVPVSRGPGPWG